MPPDVILALKRGQHPFIGCSVALQPRDAVFKGLAKARADFIGLMDLRFIVHSGLPASRLTKRGQRLPLTWA